MDLLREIGADGYPTDYLAARVRSRRAALIADERGARASRPVVAVSDEAIWGAMLTEFDWLRRQMNPRLRCDFAPVFMLFGIKTLVLCLRSKAAERHQEIERLLRHDLLADELREALRRAPDAAAAAKAIAAAFGAVLEDAHGLEAAYADGGLKAFETRLTRDYLQYVAAVRLHPAVHRFFTAFIDLRNLMTLYKHLRWGFQDPAAFVPGGTVDAARLREASASGDSGYLDACVGRMTGDAAPAAVVGEAALESRLLGGLTRALRRAGREGDEVELILDYVWSLYVQARNRALRLHAGASDAATLERELIA